MKIAKIEEMVRGWFAGSFEPTAYETDAFEAAVKHYRAGDEEAEHFHKVATEITVIITGQVEMVGRIFGPGDIITLEPGEVTKFKALTDASNVVIKHPAVANDKYLTADTNA